MACLIGKNLVLGYDKHVVLSNVNFSVDQGEYLCIIGENGSGKTTLMKTILGLIPPISGTVEYGDGLNKMEIGYLPQQTEAQKDFPASVKEVVMSGFVGKMGKRPFYTKGQRLICEENLEKMRIANLRNRCYRELSGGQQQRVLLARALCATEKMILMDEPVSGLDPKATEEMYQLIYELNRQNQISVIMISHDINAAVKYGDKILHVSEKPYFALKENYLKSPYFRHFKSLAGGWENGKTY